MTCDVHLELECFHGPWRWFYIDSWSFSQIVCLPISAGVVINFVRHWFPPCRLVLYSTENSSALNSTCFKPNNVPCLWKCRFHWISSFAKSICRGIQEVLPLNYASCRNLCRIWILGFYRLRLAEFWSWGISVLAILSFPSSWRLVEGERIGETSGIVFTAWRPNRDTWVSEGPGFVSLFGRQALNKITVVAPTLSPSTNLQPNKN